MAESSCEIPVTDTSSCCSGVGGISIFLVQSALPLQCGFIVHASFLPKLFPFSTPSQFESPGDESRRSARNSTPLMWHCRSNQSAPTPLRTSSGAPHPAVHWRQTGQTTQMEQRSWATWEHVHCIWTTPLRIRKTLAVLTLNFKRADCVNTIVHAIPMCETIATREVLHGPRRIWAIASFANR